MRNVQEGRVAVEYPQEGELVNSREYAIRVDAPGAEKVLVAINNGPWKECRRADNRWWFDWTGFGTGVHEIEAKALLQGGGALISRTRRIQADLVN